MTKSFCITTAVPVMLVPDLLAEIEAHGGNILHVCFSGVVPVKTSVIDTRQSQESNIPAYTVVFAKHPETDLPPIKIQNNPIGFYSQSQEPK